MPGDGKILTSSIPKHKFPLTSGTEGKPNLARPIKKQKISFSFAYFHQYAFFGLKGEQPHWFASLLDRLKDLSDKSPDIMGNYTAREKYRIHPVNWEQPNIPIRRSDLLTVPEVYRNNETEYPFLQFSISKSRGRVAGFFDEESAVFYIVLLDPRHNLQPAKDHGYKVDKTSPLPTPYDIVIKQTKKCSHIKSCPIGTDMIVSDDSFRTVFYDIDDAQVINALHEKGLSFYDAFCQFILSQL